MNSLDRIEMGNIRPGYKDGTFSPLPSPPPPPPPRPPPPPPPNNAFVPACSEQSTGPSMFMEWKAPAREQSSVCKWIFVFKSVISTGCQGELTEARTRHSVLPSFRYTPVLMTTRNDLLPFDGIRRHGESRPLAYMANRRDSSRLDLTRPGLT
eukprot:gene8385-biopygen9159